MKFFVNVLCYGDHPKLASRCLQSITTSADWGLVAAVQVGLNAVSDATRRVVEAETACWPVPWRLFEPVGGRNVGKYPLMRRMLYGDDLPALGHGPDDWVMWFDDDSYVRDANPAWWRLVARRVREGGDVLGSLYLMRLRDGQLRAIRDQPWFAGRPLSRRTDRAMVSFATGGWWTARYDFLARWNYPFPALHHNGGDVMLGVLCSQQSSPPAHFNDSVAINADLFGFESKAARRGLSQEPVWSRYAPGRPVDLSHHDFNVEVRCGGPEEAA